MAQRAETLLQDHAGGEEPDNNPVVYVLIPPCSKVGYRTAPCSLSARSAEIGVVFVAVFRDGPRARARVERGTFIATAICARCARPDAS